PRRQSLDPTSSEERPPSVRTVLRPLSGKPFHTNDLVTLSPPRLDGEQLIDALDRLDRDRRLVEAGEFEEVAPRMGPTRDLDDRARLAGNAIKAVKPRHRRPPASA